MDQVIVELASVVVDFVDWRYALAITGAFALFGFIMSFYPSPKPQEGGKNS